MLRFFDKKHYLSRCEADRLILSYKSEGRGGVYCHLYGLCQSQIFLHLAPTVERLVYCNQQKLCQQTLKLQPSPSLTNYPF